MMITNYNKSIVAFFLLCFLCEWFDDKTNLISIVLLKAKALAGKVMKYREPQSCISLT